MNIVIQPELKKYIQADQFGASTELNQSVIVGNAQFLSLNSKNNSESILVDELKSISIEQLKKINPCSVFDLKSIRLSAIELQNAIRHRIEIQKKIIDIHILKKQTELKRIDLERLNSFLKDESDEKKMTLGHFHSEELNRKNKEKKLLSFLDYLNSEYDNSDFILEVLKTIWSDLKKIGGFYRLGFILNNQEHCSYIVEFDGKIDRSKTIDFKNKIDIANLAQFLADAFKRPVGKLIQFSNEKENNQFIFFFEVQGQNYMATDLDQYMSERISLLSIVLQRWHLESTEIQILRQWQLLFRSYQNPVHVISENFELVQSNYSKNQSVSSKKCYEVLAARTEPCVGCPIKKNSLNKNNFVSIDSADYKVIISEFSIEQKKYFFMIYENTNEVSLLKSNVIQAEKMATIGQLSNHLAHEMNNPLTGLKLYSEMLLADNRLQNPIYENDMREVLKAISRSQIILQDLSQFASEEQTELISLDFSETVKKTMTLLKSILRSHRIFIDLKNTEILAQPTYLQQVLFNLIKNSCQAMADKGTLKIYQIETNDNFDFIIEDDGPGLPQALQDQLFKPFFTTKDVGHGTGLGLFLSHKLMNRMNAELIYNSKFSKGTQFILRFQKREIKNV